MSGRGRARFPKEPPIPTCHPDRQVMARGLCGGCYQRWRRGVSGPATPREQRIRNWTQFEVGYERPPRIQGVVQHAVTVTPEACPKCGNTRLEIRGREVWCRGHLGGCGATVYLVREEAPVEATT